VDLAVGSEIAGYRIEGVLGRGGMGVVYRATQRRLDRAVALKLIAPAFAQDPAFRERFERESRIAASIEHPNVIPVHEAGEHDGLLFISMRFVDGTDLRALLGSEGRLEAARAAALVAQVAAALDAAHARGLVHRDVKPANVLVAGEDHAYLTDFGLSKHATSAAGLTGTGQFVGTLDYIAPEQLEGGRVDARADVYALGCVLFEALTGQVPFPRDSDPAKLWAHMNEPPPRPTEVEPDVPSRFEDVIARALAKHPDDRYASAGDLGRAVLAAVEGRDASEPERMVATGEAAPSGTAAAATRVSPPAVTEGAPRPPAGSRRLALVAVLAAVAAAAITAGVIALAGGGDDEPSSPASATAEPGALTTTQVEDRLNAFTSLFTAEQAEEIGRMLTPQGDFAIGEDSSSARDDVIAQLQARFDTLEQPVLSLDALDIDVEEQQASASARYAIEAQNAPPDVGTISFHVVKIGDAVLIDGLHVESG
jgi:predicted Ser/Thr protein kinase